MMSKRHSRACLSVVAALVLAHSAPVICSLSSSSSSSSTSLPYIGGSCPSALSQQSSVTSLAMNNTCSNNSNSDNSNKNLYEKDDIIEDSAVGNNEAQAAPIRSETGDKNNKWLMDPSLVLEILNSPAPFANSEEEDICRRLVLDLTEEEQETAARTSYAYFVWSSATLSSDKNGRDSSHSAAFGNESIEVSFDNTAETKGTIHNSARSGLDDRHKYRLRMAMREARRHWRGQGQIYNKALSNLKSTCEMRKQYNIDLLRTCGSNYETSLRQQRYRELLIKDLSTQLMVVRGHDRDNRAILIKLGRTRKETDPEAYTLAQLYMAERALACSEALSKGRQEKTLAVFDFGSYSSANSPPTSLITSFVKLIGQNYPERSIKVFILDPPLWMRGLFTLVQPFLAKDTREKVVLLSGQARKEQSISEHIDSSQATPFMLADGTLTKQVDVEHMLQNVPFHVLYDDFNDNATS